MHTLGGATPLMYACQQCRENDVLEILSKNPYSVKERDRTLKTPLHYCAENSNTSCAEAILKLSPSLVNAQDENGYSTLHLAVIAGNKPLIKLLITKGADVNIIDNEGHCAVHWAIVSSEKEALEIIIRAGANPSTPDIHGGYPLHYAVQMCGPNCEYIKNPEDAIKVVRTLLNFGVDVNVKDKDGRQPILWAASAGSADVVMNLISAGACVEAADKDGLTALHCAASRGHTTTIETLVTLCGADVDVIDGNGCSALFYAVTLGHADATEILLQLGAEPNRQDRKGRTPAHCGAAKGQLETLKILQKHGGNVWMRNVKGDIPLHEAVASGRKDLVLWFLSQSPEAVNISNNDGRCPIHIASMYNNTEMIKVLLELKSLVNPIMRTSKGILMTPLNVALTKGYRSCGKYLQLHGGVPFSRVSKVDTTKNVYSITISPSSDVPNKGILETLTPTHIKVSSSKASSDSNGNEGDSAEKKKVYRRRKKRKSSPNFDQEGSDSDDSYNNLKRRTHETERVKSDDNNNNESGFKKEKHTKVTKKFEKNKEEKSVKTTSVTTKSPRASAEKKQEVVEEKVVKIKVESKPLRRNKSFSETKIVSDLSPEDFPPLMETVEHLDMEIAEGEADINKLANEEDAQVSLKTENPTVVISTETDLLVKDEILKENKDYIETSENKVESEGEKQIEKIQEEKTEVENAKEDEKVSQEVPANEGDTTPQVSVTETHTYKEDKKGEKENKSPKSKNSSEVSSSSRKSDKSGRSSASKSGSDRDILEKVENSSKTKISNKGVTEEKNKKGNNVHKDEKSTKSSRKKSPNNKVTEDNEKSKMSLVKTAIVDETITKVNGVNNGDDIPQTENDLPTPSDTFVVENSEGNIEKNNSEGEVPNVENEMSTNNTEANIVQEVQVEKIPQTSDTKTEPDESVVLVQSEENIIIDSEKKNGTSSPLHIEEDSSVVDKDVAEPSNTHPQNDDSHETVVKEKMESEVPDEQTESEIKTENIPLETTVKSPVDEVIIKTEIPTDDKEPASSTAFPEEKVVETSSEATGEKEADSNENSTQKLEISEKLSDVESLNDNLALIVEGNDIKVVKISPEVVSSEVLVEENSTAEEQIPSQDKKNDTKTETISESATAETEQTKGVAEIESSLDVNKNSEKIEETGDSENKISSVAESNEAKSDVQDGDSILKNSKNDLETDQPAFECLPDSVPNNDDNNNNNGSTSGYQRHYKAPRVSRLCRRHRELKGDVNQISVTQLVQNTIRKYHMERGIFYQLLELKRMQIRAGRANEQVLVKRLADEYERSTAFAGMKHFSGLYKFREFEKFLYDQLKALNSRHNLIIPEMKSYDDIDALSGILKKSRYKVISDIPQSERFCTAITQRCHHSACAYTTVPCSTYIANLHRYKSHKPKKECSLPRIDQSPTFRTEKQKLENQPPTLELIQGNEKRVITLPQSYPEKGKRYYVTFTIKGSPSIKEEGFFEEEKHFFKERHAKSV